MSKNFLRGQEPILDITDSDDGRDDDFYDDSSFPSSAPTSVPSSSPTTNFTNYTIADDDYIQWGCNLDNFNRDCEARNISGSVNPSEIIFALECVENNTSSNSTYGSGAFIEEVRQAAFCGKNNSYDIICHNGTIYDNNFQAEPLCQDNLTTIIPKPLANHNSQNWAEDHSLEIGLSGAAIFLVGAAIAACLCCRRNSDRVTDYRGV